MDFSFGVDQVVKILSVYLKGAEGTTKKLKPTGLSFLKILS